ncbi:MAG: HipA domain-containing protein [Lachnospiraceae bacterium]|nr:HipA domain-containing protein [Lachnospiraceae bacterium]
MPFLLHVQIEIDGSFVEAGTITGNDSRDAVFTYDSAYAENPLLRPVSLSFPKQASSFSPAATRNFFEGLLPEGFTRRFIAKTLHADSSDYISILRELGGECIGAIKIVDKTRELPAAGYRRLTADDILALAAEGATRSVDLVVKSHLSLAGASGKAGLYYDEPTKTWYQPTGDAPSTHIVKQSHIRLANIVTNEQLCLQTAKKLGITIPSAFILTTGDPAGRKDTVGLPAFDDSSVLFVTGRYDRYFPSNAQSIEGLPVPRRLHQEDFAQALGIPAEEKYEKPGSDYLQKIFRCILTNSANPMADALELWRICIFNYLVGNTDNHIKNISLLYSGDMRSIRLAPAYDIVSTVVYPSGTEEMSLSINKKTDINTISKEDYLAEAKRLGMGRGFISDIFDELSEGFRNALLSTSEELEAEGLTAAPALAEKILSIR